MAKVIRKDSNGYILRKGECQRANGRYVYSYTDREGTRHFVNASSLVELRRKETMVQRLRHDGITPSMAEKMTLNQLYDRYMDQKFNLKDTTKANYIYMYDHFVRDTFGKRKITGIKYTDIKIFYHSILSDKKMKANTLECINNQISPAFDMAIRDDILVKNPAIGVMREIKKSKLWIKEKRHAFTIPQQIEFTRYVASEKQFKGWEPIITVLLGTGMRIGECLALRWEDCDFEKRQIYVNYSLSNRPNGKGYCELHVTEPKTKASIRKIPMFDEVYDALLEEYQIQCCLGFCTQEIDGLSGFVFSTAHGTVYSENAVNHAIHRIIDCYNKEEKQKAKQEKREPVLLPQISAHHMRHTFCTRLCESESNLKVIQEIMGHADIRTTMDIYAECTQEKLNEVVTKLKGKIIITYKTVNDGLACIDK